MEFHHEIFFSFVTQLHLLTSAKQAARKYVETFSEETYSAVWFIKDIQVAWLGLAEISVRI